MKRYSFHGVHEIDAKPTDDIDGEWIRYSDHVEAMKRIAGAPVTQGLTVGDLLDWLDAEISAVSCRYHDDPSYCHDAYWFKEKALKLVAEARKLYAAPEYGIADSQVGS